MTLTDAQATAMRAHYSRDLCRCGHLRQLHYSRVSVSTGPCADPECLCQHYAWQPAEGDVSWF